VGIIKAIKSKKTIENFLDNPKYIHKVRGGKEENSPEVLY
jgi:hypothetical protein